MKVALVHDYLNEFGGAERVLLALSEIYPQAPIYTAFALEGSPAWDRFKDRRIIESWAAKIPGFRTKLHSPLRFLTPLIWESFNLNDYDVVISSSSWFMPKGVLTRPETVHICYCHTPPRYLYGYATSIEWQKYWPIRIYAHLINKKLREYDFLSSQRVDVFVANSENVARRIEKFYRRDSVVIHPPVEINSKLEIRNSKLDKNYYLTGGRLVGAKHFDLAIMAANKLGVTLKIYGDGPLRNELQKISGKTVEFLGRVSEVELVALYRGAKAFIALAEDEDFGITPVEAMAHGCPVTAYKGGGYLETIAEGQTGVFVEDLNIDSVIKAISKLDTLSFEAETLHKHSQKFNNERFTQELRKLVRDNYNKLITS